MAVSHAKAILDTSVYPPFLRSHKIANATFLIGFLVLCLFNSAFGQAGDPVKRGRDERPTAPPPVSETRATKAFDVVFSNGLLSVYAENVGVKALLEEIGRMTGIEISISSTLEEKKVTVQFSNSDLESALEKILRNGGIDNYAWVYHPSRTPQLLKKIYVTGQPSTAEKSSREISSPQKVEQGKPTIVPAKTTPGREINFDSRSSRHMKAAGKEVQANFEKEVPEGQALQTVRQFGGAVVTPAPKIGRSPTTLSFTATQGGANPPPQTLNITNTGGGTLSWALSDDASWLTLSPTSGTTTTEADAITAIVNIARLMAGTYQAAITITAGGATNAPQTVPVTLTVNPTPQGPFAYISNFGSNTISVINTSNDTIFATVPVGTNPFGVAVSPTGTRVYVTNFNGNSVSFIDTAFNTVTGTVAVENEPRGITVHPAETHVYVANGSSMNVSVIDAASNTVIGTVALGGAPFGLAIHPSGTLLYVTTGADTVSVIDAVNNILMGTVTVENSPAGVAVHPSGTYVYVANQVSNTLSVIDAATSTVIATVPVGSGPRSVAVDPTGMRVYVTNFDSDDVSIVDTFSNTVTATVAVGNGPDGAAIHPAGTRVYVTNSLSNTLSVIDSASNTVIGTVPVGSQPVGFGQFTGPLSAPLTVNPATIPAGGSIAASWSEIANPTATDWIGLYTPGADDTAYMEWIYVSCSQTPGSARPAGSCPFVIPAWLAPGVYELRLFSNNGLSRLATSNTFAVTITTLSADPTVIGAGGTITATWSDITIPTSTDWIGLYTPGADDTAYMEWIYVSCSQTPGTPQASGSCPFVLPGWLAPGDYELRLFSNNGLSRLATSNTFAVSN